jgi:hypothetical protein
MNPLSVLQYAVYVLKVQDVIVCRRGEALSLRGLGYSIGTEILIASVDAVDAVGAGSCGVVLVWTKLAIW